MSSNIGMPASEKGTLQLNLNYDWNNLTRLRAENRTLDTDSRQRETHSLLLEMGYSFSDAFSVDVFLSAIRQERTIFSSISSDDFVFTQGIGDVVILPKYTFKKKWTFGIGLKIPTGESSKSNNGIALSADLQPGSGALDQIFYFAHENAMKSRPTMGYFGNIIFTNRGENKNYFGSSTYGFGNEIQVIAGVSDRFQISTIQVDPSLQLRYRKAERDFFNGTAFPSSGGEFLFITPGLSFLIGQKFSWHMKASFPLYAFVNETQLSPTVRLSTGILFKINLKPTKLFEQ